MDKETRSKSTIELKRSFPRHKKDYEKANKKRKTETQDFVDLTIEKQSRERESDFQTDIDLTCLFSPNWLNDEVINTYLKLLNRHNSKIFMYESQFHHPCIKGKPTQYLPPGQTAGTNMFPHLFFRLKTLFGPQTP